MSGSNLKDAGIGIALRQSREDLNWSQREAAARSGFSNATISRWETGTHAPTSEDLASYCTTLQMSSEKRNELLSVLHKRSESHWLAVREAEQRQQFVTMLDLERKAIHITSISPILIPGLLQTYDYAVAIMERHGFDPQEVTQRVAVRMGRREAIKRSHPAQLVAVVGESALRQRIGGPQVMLDQLRYLPEAAAASNVELRVLADDNDWHPALEGAFILVEFSDRTPVVQIENRRSAVYFDEDEDIEVYRDAVRKVLDVAMSPADSMEHIAAAITAAERRLEAR